MSDLEAKELGRSIGIEIFATFGSTHDWFFCQVETASRTPIPQSAIINFALEPVFFMVANVTRLAQRYYGEPRLGDLVRELNETILGLLSDVVFESEWKESDFALHKGKLAKHYYYWLPIRQNYYSRSRSTLRGKLARLISSGRSVDVFFLQPILESTLQEGTFKIPSDIIKELSIRIANESDKICKEFTGRLSGSGPKS
jgi:hypothetical protein